MNTTILSQKRYNKNIYVNFCYIHFKLVKMLKKLDIEHFKQKITILMWFVVAQRILLIGIRNFSTLHNILLLTRHNWILIIFRLISRYTTNLFMYSSWSAKSWINLLIIITQVEMFTIYIFTHIIKSYYNNLLLYNLWYWFLQKIVVLTLFIWEK